jgi:large subunit ribosomal protein L6
MSRIGKKPVAVLKGVTASVNGQEVSVKGPKGELKHVLVDDVIAKLDDGSIEVSPREDTQNARAMWGMSRTPMQGSNLQLQLGYSHDVAFPIPKGIQVVCPKPTEIVITGIDKQQVGQVAAEIRRFRPPEPYKGKGVRYAGEFILRKEGKKK